MAKLQFEIVSYTDSNGFVKPAVIIGTRKSTQKGTQVPRPDKGNANLCVISPLDPIKRSYLRHNISEGTGPRQFQRLSGATAEGLAEFAGIG